MQETWVQFLGQEDPLEKETATHSSILAWEIPRTEEPGALQSMGCKRVRHNLETKQQLYTVLYWINTLSFCFIPSHYFIYALKIAPFSPLDFPGSSDGKASAYNAGDPGSIPGLVASWQKWDSCTISPLSDSTHHG